MRKRRWALRRMIGIAPEDIALYPMLTAAENLLFFGRIFGFVGSELKNRIEELLHDVGLEARRNYHVATFSNGMKRRLNLALAVMHRPKLILLDEPTAGVDPRSRDQILSVVRGLRDKGSAILYTTHYIDEAEKLCDRVGILNHGQLIALGAIDTLLGELDFSEIVEVRGLANSVDWELFAPCRESRAPSEATGLCACLSEAPRIYLNLSKEWWVTPNLMCASTLRPSVSIMFFCT